MEVLNGKEFSDAIKTEVATELRKLKERYGIELCLTVVRVGQDPASAGYVRNKVKTAHELGIISKHKHLPENTTQEELLAVVRELNESNDIDGIIVQLPLPKQIDEKVVLESINPEKDVDGFHPVNVGRLSQGQDSLAPCTPAGIINMLKKKGIKIAGQDAVVIGRSNIVGKPMAMMLLQENATITVCHSVSSDVASVCCRADILVSAVGIAGFITKEHIKKGATVIDVGMNRIRDVETAKQFFAGDELEKRLRTIKKLGSTLVGDVNAKDAEEHAGYFTPVPGGVGLLTVSMLMKNTLKAAKMRRFKASGKI